MRDNVCVRERKCVHVRMCVSLCVRARANKKEGGEIQGGSVKSCVCVREKEVESRRIDPMGKSGSE